MSFDEDQVSVINRFKHLVMSPPCMRQQVAEKLEDSAPPQRQNAIYQKGLSYQQKQSARRRLDSTRPKPPPTIREQILHEMIVQHPYLLHTPELYAGGLYLDALINKYRLPCGLITDFTYITVQERVIKITLVEIEKASKGVFHTKARLRQKCRSTTGVTKFRSETEAAIEQVRSWRKEMKHESSRQTLLLNLKQLFSSYPVEIFDAYGAPSRFVEIEVSYVLVVGQERPIEPEHQNMIDDLYLNEEIILMTYPEMIDLVRQYQHDKNVIKVGPHGIQTITARVPDRLMPIADHMNASTTNNTDPYGVKLAGLGWLLESSNECNLAMHPASVKAIFYRSRGLCEHPDCNAPVVTSGKVYGSLSPIYSFRDDGNDYPSFWKTKFVALACPRHLYNISPIVQNRVLSKPHSLNRNGTLRWPYRAELDQQAQTYSLHWQENWMNELPRLLELCTENDSETIANLRTWSRAVMSLPRYRQKLIAAIVEDFFLQPLTSHRLRDAELVTTHEDYHYLHLARLIRVNPTATKGHEIEPTIFNQPFIDHLRDLYGVRATTAINALCTGNIPERVQSLNKRHGRRSLDDQR